MKITQVETIPITAHIDREIMITSSLGSHLISQYLLVQVQTDEELVGLGEATVAPAWSGESQGGAKAMIDHHLGPALVEENPFNVERLMQKLDQIAPANFFSKAALEMALLDLVGKKLNVPVYDLLGGKCRSYDIPIKFVVAAVEPEAAARNAARMVARGFNTIKIKVARGADINADVARVKRVREAVGPQVHLTVDANGGWTVADAIRAIRRLEPFELELVEQPVQRQDIRGMAQVRTRVGIPIMADEAVFSVRDALEVIRQDAADIISVYPGKNGGILKAKLIAQMAAAADKPCHIGSNLELEVGLAAMAHLAVATPNIQSERYPADILGSLYHLDHITQKPLHIGAGIARVPDGPGLGVSLDQEQVAKLRAREIERY